MQRLTDFAPASFLKKYWQKKPLLIKQAYPNFINPLDKQQLQQLATMKTVEARIILEKGGKNPWELRHGSFSKQSFSKLPATHWTLLVQGTNHWVTELQLLLEDFYFIPQWRIEDIMTSFAVKGGSVGAHLDNYDVFLLQAEGRREWRISNKPITTAEFLPDYEIKLLSKFTPDKIYILNPGDMLYLPPRFAHHGIALDNNCITHSIGFRAPSLQEMLEDYVTHLLSIIDPQIRYTDPDLSLQKNSGAINTNALNKVIKLIKNNINDKMQIKRWLGQFISKNKYSENLPVASAISKAELVTRIKQGEQLVKNPVTCLIYFKVKDKWFFYANGREYILTKTLAFAAPLLTAKTSAWQQGLAKAIKQQEFQQLLLELTNDGCFYFQ